jgi:hypothetical protein
MERKQFTCYESFFNAIKRIKKPAERCAAYDALMNYAFYGTEPNYNDLPESVAIVMDLVTPVLINGRNKAMNRLNKTKTNEEQTKNKSEQNESKEERNEVLSSPSYIEREKEGEREIEIEKDTYIPPTPKGEKQTMFDKFWQAYPKKIGKQDAEKAFRNVKVPIETLLDAIEKQKYSNQWTKDNGQYIPNPATWLRQGRWDDEVYITATTTSGRMQVPKTYEGESILDELFPDT